MTTVSCGYTDHSEYKKLSLQKVVSDSLGFLYMFFVNFVKIKMQNLCSDDLVFENEKQVHQTLVDLSLAANKSLENRNGLSEGLITIFIQEVRRERDKKCVSDYFKGRPCIAFSVSSCSKSVTANIKCSSAPFIFVQKMFEESGSFLCDEDSFYYKNSIIREERRDTGIVFIVYFRRVSSL